MKMAINPVNPIKMPLLPVVPEPRKIPQPLPLDVGKTFITNIVNNDKLVLGMQYIEKSPHKVIEGAREKKLYI
jgi:hypothetical protein